MDFLANLKISEKNIKLINAIIARVKRDFKQDIDLIGLTGSLNTDDIHDRSDIDLIIISNNNKAGRFSVSFILDDVGYDFNSISWGKAEEMATLESRYTTCLVDLKILYVANQTALDRFNTLKESALKKLSEPIGVNCIERANKLIQLAKIDYAEIMLSDNVSSARYFSGCLIRNLITCIAHMNNNYIKRGVKRFLEEMSVYEYLPENFNTLYFGVIESKNISEIKIASEAILIAVINLHNALKCKHFVQPIPTSENLKRLYEKCWCNYKNKTMDSVEKNDKAYAFHVAVSAQKYFNNLPNICGIQRFDLMQYFDPNNLNAFKQAFLKAMCEILSEYRKVGLSVEQFSDFYELNI